MKRTITVVIPALNEEEKLGECLESLTNQSFRDFEVIVVDNASTDADTVVSPDWLELIYCSFQEDPDLVGVYGRVLLKKGSSPSHYFNQLIPLTDPLLTSFLEVSHSLSLPHFYGANFAVRKRFFERAGRVRSRDGCFYRVSEDVRLGLKLRKVGEVRFLKDLVVYTSARKLDSGSWKVPLTNAKNYISMAVLGKEI